MRDHCPPLAFPLASEMDRRPEPRTRSQQTKLRRGSGSPFCLVEQSYGVCGAHDERTHAGQQQQLVDQLGHDVLPRNGSGKTTTGSRNFGSATACGPLGFIALMRAAGEQVASWASGAFVFKTLSTTGGRNMAKAADYPVKPVMLVAGDDAREEAGTKSAAFDNSGRCSEVLCRSSVRGHRPEIMFGVLVVVFCPDCVSR